MAISREEIDEIAKVVAERVVSIAHPCYCGWAVWEVGDTLDQLSENLQYKKGEALEANKPHIIAILERIENTCVVDMTEPKSHLKDIYERVQSREWDYAYGALHELDESIGNKLRSQITKGSNPSNPNGGKFAALREILSTKTVEEAIAVRGKYRHLTLLPDELEVIDRHFNKLKSYPDLMKGG